MTKSFARSGILILVFLSATVLVWVLSYPSESDPKNIKYVLWKHGLYPMDPDRAVGTMIGDKGREKLVLGKRKTDLERRFGYLKAPADATPYMKGCYLESPWKEQDVLVIRDVPWMVLFSGGRAVDLRLCKG